MRTRHLWVLSACVVLSLLLLVAGTVAAQESATDPFDTSVYQKQISDLGVPTRQDVKNAASRAQQLFDKADYEQALPALQEWARKANWLANIIAGALEPFYSASYDDRKNFSYAQLAPLIAYETMANDLKRERNHAMVMQAECLVKLGRITEAASIYLKALDLIDIKDWDWWTRALDGLYGIIGIPSISKK